METVQSYKPLLASTNLPSAVLNTSCYGPLAAALKYLVFVSVLLLGYVELLPKSGPPLKRGHCWTLLDVTNVFLLLAAGVLSAFGGGIQFREHVLRRLAPPHSLAGAVADFFTALALVLMAVITILRTQRVLGSSGFICVLLGLLVMATMTDLFLLQDLLYSNQEAHLHTVELTVIANTLLAVVMVGAFLTEGLRDNAFRKTFKGRKESRGTAERERSSQCQTPHTSCTEDTEFLCGDASSSMVEAYLLYTCCKPVCREFFCMTNVTRVSDGSAE